MMVEAHHPTMRNWLLPNETTMGGGRKNERLTPPSPPSIVSHLPPSPPPCAGRSVNFTIAEILKPDFAQHVLTDTKKSRDSIKQIISTGSRFGHGSYGQEAIGARGCLKASSSVSHQHRPHAELAKGPYHSKRRQAEKQTKKPTSTELNFGERHRHFSNQSSSSRTCSVPCSPLSPPPTPSSPSASESGSEKSADDKLVWPAWVYCTRYSDRPSAGPRSRKIKRKDRPSDEKRPRTAFTTEQLVRLKKEFDENRYLTEDRRKNLAQQLDLNESQIKIWFQNKRAKLKKTQGTQSKLASELINQGLYNHATVATDSGDEL